MPIELIPYITFFPLYYLVWLQVSSQDSDWYKLEGLVIRVSVGEVAQEQKIGWLVEDSYLGFPEKQQLR